MTADELRAHIRYSGWASRKLLDAAQKLDEEHLTREMGASHHSLLQTLAHIHYGDRVWFSRVVDPAIEVYPTTSLLPLPRLDEEWTVIQKRWEEWAGTLTDADVGNVASYKNFKGETEQIPVCKILMHVVNHATLHRGQAMAMLRRLGVQPPGTDLIYYYREQM